MKKINLVPLKVKLLPALLHVGIWFSDKTFRVTKINEPTHIKEPKIYATWHGRQHCFLQIQPRNKLNILVSKSNDGEIITQALLKLGYKIIRGSASRGGIAAAKQMLAALNNGDNVAFTVDGPRGPIYDVKSGVIKLAQLSEAPIIPVIPATKHKLIINSWDKYNAPIWFCKIYYYFGSPMYIDKNASEEKLEMYRLELTKNMKQLTFDADKSCNYINNDLNIEHH